VRKIWALLVGMLVLVICLPALAQDPRASSFFTGVNPRDIQPKNLVQPTKALKNYNLSKTMRTPAQPSVFNLSRVFPKISLGRWPPVVPSVPVLGQKDNPFQPNPPKGVNLFDPPKK
jgi:hypothetical protein